jgi:hypothetical protein
VARSPIAREKKGIGGLLPACGIIFEYPEPRLPGWRSLAIESVGLLSTKAGEPPQSGRLLVLPDRDCEARGDMAHAATTGFGMARPRCAGALDEPTANQVEMLQANGADQSVDQLSDNACPIESELLSQESRVLGCFRFAGLRS